MTLRPALCCTSVAIALLTGPSPLSAQLVYASSAFRPGEILTYKVKWSFIRLGTIIVRQDAVDGNFPGFVQVWLNGESATGLPFISVFFRSTSLLDSARPTSYLYELMTDREDRERTAYIYDPVNARSFGLGTSGGSIVRLDTMDAPGPYYDGIGLFMYARAAAGSDTTVTLPTVMDYAMGPTTIRFRRDVEPVSVDAFDEQVPAYAFDGTTEWKGSAFAGMSGAFRGWVSADSLRLVLRAEVAILLGSAVIELERAGFDRH